MNKAIATAFELQPISLPLERVLPTRTLPEGVRESKRYKTIAMSIAEVGLIEPLVVHAPKGQKNTYLLLDGHVRLEALKDLGEKQVTCLLATDDEGYTYNHKVNRLAPIQAQRMIVRALREGVSTERIAKALNLSPSTIAQQQSLLIGICPEAVDLLKDRPIGESALRYFKWVKPMRQIDMAELMVSSGNFSVGYAKALATTTRRIRCLRPSSRRSERSSTRTSRSMSRRSKRCSAISRW